MSKLKQIAPSILSADFMNLGKDIAMINNSNTNWIHLDIMDGCFVPNITFGFEIVKGIRKSTNKTLDTHLMICNPDRYIDQFAESGSDIITVHYEACNHLSRTIQHINSKGKKAGVAINPHTNISLLEDILDNVNLVCIMSVNPGFGGQKFIENTYSKINKLKEMILKKNLDILIEVDGGVSIDNRDKLLAAGTDIFVAGSYVFGSHNPVDTINKYFD